MKLYQLTLVKDALAPKWLMHEKRDARVLATFSFPPNSPEQMDVTRQKGEALIRALYLEECGVSSIDTNFDFGAVQQLVESNIVPISTLLSDDGDRLTTIYLVKADTEEHVLTLLKENNIEKTRCRHDYDCCGHFYGEAPQVVCRLDKAFMVVWENRRNA